MTTPPPSESVSLPVELHLLDHPNRVILAHIRHASACAFELTCPEPLSKGQRLALTHDGRRIDVEVAKSEPATAEIYHLTMKILADEFGEVRSEYRLRMEFFADLQIAGDPSPIRAQVVDISPSGLGIELESPIERGSKVCIHLEQGPAFGEIRFCKQQPSGRYFAGFLLEHYLEREETGAHR